jgi:hypothetical protein
MIVCPVCEHPQAQGTECEVCGKRLAPGPAEPAAALPRVPDLEPTAHAPGGAPSERLADLEPTGHAGAQAVALDAVPDLEATRAAPVDVATAPIPDVEPTRTSIPGDAPTAVPAVIACRYCRTPAAPGERICGRCGMRLPAFGSAAAQRAGGGEPAARLCSCGAPVRGALCPSCGARMAP